MLRIIVPSSFLIGLPSPETIPVVSVLSKPNGFPMARTFCPTLRLSELPNGIVESSMPAGGSNFNTAISDAESVPTTVPSYWEPSESDM